MNVPQMFGLSVHVINNGAYTKVPLLIQIMIHLVLSYEAYESVLLKNGIFYRYLIEQRQIEVIAVGIIKS